MNFYPSEFFVRGLCCAQTTRQSLRLPALFFSVDSSRDPWKLSPTTTTGFDFILSLQLRHILQAALCFVGSSGQFGAQLMRQIQQLTEHVFIFPFSKKSFIFLIRLPPTQSTYAQSNLKKVKTNVGSDIFLCYPMIFPYKSMQICVGEEVVCRFPSARWLYKLLDDTLLFPLGPSLIY